MIPLNTTLKVQLRNKTINKSFIQLNKYAKITMALRNVCSKIVFYFQPLEDSSTSTLYKNKIKPHIYFVITIKMKFMFVQLTEFYEIMFYSLDTCTN